MKQPEALRLADILQHKLPSIECLEIAAAELRRLHEVNQMLLEALNLITFECGNLHHASKDRHGFEPCPVEARIYAAIEKAGEA